MIQHLYNELYVGNLRGYEDCQLNLRYLAMTHSGVPRGDFKRIDMIDADDPYYFHLGQFKDAVEFISGGPTLVFCDQGASRSPSVAVALLAMLDIIDPRTYFKACADFRQMYPWYAPNTGIRTFMAQNWEAIQDSILPFKDLFQNRISGS